MVYNELTWEFEDGILAFVNLDKEKKQLKNQ
jgi:hypothetical protein